MMVAFTAKANADLKAIGDHIVQGNRRRAKTFVAELRECCLGIADMPRAFPVSPRHRDRGLRRRTFGRYLIFYREDAGRILIVPVLHGAMDLDA